MTTSEIKRIQGIVGTTQDGVMGAKTTAAIKAYQNKLGVTADGIWGSKTESAYTKSQGSSSGSTSTNKTYTSPTGYVYNTDANGSPTGNPISGPSSSSSSSPSNTGGENYSTSGDTPYSYYGNDQKRDATAEQQSLTEEQSIADVAQGAGILSSNTVSSITSDPSLVAFYVNALTYGGYTVGDVLNDMKRRELINTGGTNAENLKSLAIIDPTQTKSTYTATAAGQKAVADAAKAIPTFNFQGLLNPDILKYGSDIPDDLFKTLVPLLDPSSQEFKDAVATVKSTYFDLATSALQATTEQDKAVADYNLDQFKQQLDTKYGIVLSDDATKAWTQIQSIEDTMSTNGLSGSGMQNEAIDDSLKTTRLQDQRQRDAKLTESEQNKAAYYRASASSSEIAALTPEERQKYGLIPSADVLDQYSVANLKAKNPSWSDAMVQAAHNSVIDENGNYRSTLYSTYYTSKSNTEQTNQATATTAVETDAKNKEAAAYKDYSSDTADLGQIVKGNTTPAASSTESTTPSDTTNTSKVDTNTADKYNIYTGALNPNYKAPVTTPTSPATNITVPNVTTPSTTTTVPKATITTPAKTGYTGSSIVDYLSTTGKDSSYNSRKALAAAQGITNYTGSSDQNTQLLTKLRGY